jgi:exonuclease SbcD
MIKFIHTADIHFGMENYGKIDPKTGIHTRLLDFSRALHFCIDRAIVEKVDLFLFSGDAYKTANPTPTHQRLLFQCFLRLFKAGIPIVIIVGNHDNPLSFGKAHALELFGQLPLDGFHVMAQPATLIIETVNGPVQIVGIPWPTRANITLTNNATFKSETELTEYISQSIATIIATLAEKLNPEIPAILAGHLTVSSGIFSGSEKRAIYGTDPVFMPSQLAIPPFDYVALGHLHRYQNLNLHGYPAVIYSGSIERVDFGERKEEKGFCLVTIHEKGNTTHEFIPTPTRPFIQINVDIDSEQGQTEKILNAIRKHVLEEAVIKIVYHLPVGINDRVDLTAIQNALAHAHHVVGVFPVREFEQRKHRAAVKVDMDLSELLDAYFKDKPEFTENKARLIQKALELQAESTCANE